MRGDLTSEFLIARPSRVKSPFGFRIAQLGTIVLLIIYQKLNLGQLRNMP